MVETLLNISTASCGQLVKMLITVITTWYTTVYRLLYYFNTTDALKHHSWCTPMALRIHSTKYHSITQLELSFAQPERFALPALHWNAGWNAGALNGLMELYMWFIQNPKLTFFVNNFFFIYILLDFFLELSSSSHFHKSKTRMQL